MTWKDSVTINNRTYFYKKVLCFSVSQFETILEEIYPDQDFEWGVEDGYIWFTGNGDLNTDLSNYFGEEVSSTHADGVDIDVGIWVVFRNFEKENI